MSVNHPPHLQGPRQGEKTHLQPIPNPAPTMRRCSPHSMLLVHRFGAERKILL